MSQEPSHLPENLKSKTFWERILKTILKYIEESLKSKPFRMALATLFGSIVGIIAYQIFLSSLLAVGIGAGISGIVLGVFQEVEL